MSVLDLDDWSTDGFPIRGWLLAPKSGAPTRGFIRGHGSGGVDEPGFALPDRDAACLIPCFRGLGRSWRPPIPDNPAWHVLHDIHLRGLYISGGCVEDLWFGVSALIALHPRLAGRADDLGTHPLRRGIGALGLPWEPRLPTLGSVPTLQAFARTQAHVAQTLAYYDAAVAARHIRQPTHLTAGLFDPAIAPPGQFAIYNALPAPKWLSIRTADHLEHPSRAAQERQLLADLQ